MAKHFDRATNKKLGRVTQLENLEETGWKEGDELEKKLYKAIRLQVVKDTKKPRKSPEKLKTKTFRVRLTEQELEKLEAIADAKNKTPSEVMREWLWRSRVHKS
jgi:N-acetylmuramoyl-L-alanine amidase CwlA